LNLCLQLLHGVPAAGWQEMMVVVESSMAGGRKEVALAAVALLSAVLQAHGPSTDIVSPDMWKRAVRALDVGVEAATSPSCMVPLTVGARARVAASPHKTIGSGPGTHLWQHCGALLCSSCDPFQCNLTLQVRTELLALIGQLYVSLRSRFDAEDTVQVFIWTEKFSRNPWSGALHGRANVLKVFS